MQSKGAIRFVAILLLLASLWQLSFTAVTQYQEKKAEKYADNKAEAAMQIIDDNSRAIRGELGRLVAKQFRIVPELVFYQDSTLDYVAHIDELLKK